MKTIYRVYILDGKKNYLDFNSDNQRENYILASLLDYKVRRINKKVN
jgi:hypothetical protein